MKIKYTFANGETSEVEVSSELGELLLDFDRLEHNNDQTETRRHSSLSSMEYEGDFFIDPAADIVELVERHIQSETLRRAMDSLLPQQRELIIKVYFKGLTVASIASEEGVNEAAIRNRLKKTYARMKKSLD